MQEKSVAIPKSRVAKDKRKVQKDRYGYYFLIPFAVIFIGFNLYPIIYTFYLSLTTYDGLNNPEFSWFSNYSTLLSDPMFYGAFYNTMKIWLVAFVPQIGIALILAFTFTITKIKGSGIFKALFYVPNLVTAATIGVLFSTVLGFPDGALNQFLIALNIIDNPVNFLTIPNFAQNSVSAITWWMWFGNNMIICLAGMTAISKDYYEAARIDGANVGQIFFQVTIPLMRPILIYLMLTSFIGGLQIFDLAQVMTDGLGAPDNSLNTLVLYLYNQGFVFSNFGYSSAIAYSMFFIVLLFSIVIFFFNKKWRIF